MCRISGSSVRNRYMAFSNGGLIGQHDKDLPTMWENAFYEGGETSDIGVLGNCDGVRVGAAVCWEYMRTMTARRLRNKVDVIMGGSCWWSIPEFVPWPIRKQWEAENALNAISAIQDTAWLVGVPVIHAAHCGRMECPLPGFPITHRGHFEGNAAIIDASGSVVAHRGREEGEGFVCAEISLGGKPIHQLLPKSYWLRKRGFLPWIAWHYQRWLGKLWYRRHVVL
jgi:predicted amidohydrolase